MAFKTAAARRAYFARAAAQQEPQALAATPSSASKQAALARALRDLGFGVLDAPTGRGRSR